ncbi:MAG: hypothetical protein ACERKD_03040 [Prolixibacteraceae bacterium]
MLSPTSTRINFFIPHNYFHNTTIEIICSNAADLTWNNTLQNITEKLLKFIHKFSSMAQLLYERQSSKLVLNTVKRHRRLSRQTKGAEEYANTIESGYNALTEKVKATEQAAENYENMYDQMVLTDAQLDDKVRDLAEASKKYDRDHPGELTGSLLFPNGATPIMYVSYNDEPALVDQLILKINVLGAEHALAVHIEPLQTAVDASKAAISALNNSIEAKKMAEALEQIAKINLIRQYAQNIYAAYGRFGKPFTKRLFPRITIPSKATEDSEDS